MAFLKKYGGKRWKKRRLQNEEIQRKDIMERRCIVKGEDRKQKIKDSWSE